MTNRCKGAPGTTADARASDMVAGHRRERGAVDQLEQTNALGGIEVCADADPVVVRLWGDVDASLRDQASLAMVALVNRGGPYVVDVSGVTFLDSSGIAFMLQVHRMATDQGSTAVLRDPPALVIELLDLIGLDGTIPLEFSAGDAADRDQAVRRIPAP